MRITITDADVVVQNWWAIVLRGAVALIFGVLTIFEPGVSLVALLIAFGAYVFVDGVLAIAAAVRGRRSARLWGLLLLQGVAGIAAGIMTLVWPIVTMLALLYFVAAWGLVTGVLEVVSAIRLRKSIKGEWLLALSGVLSVTLGVVLMLYPGPGALALVLWTGIYANISGVLLIALGLRLRASGKAPAHDVRHGHSEANRSASHG